MDKNDKDAKLNKQTNEISRNLANFLQNYFLNRFYVSLWSMSHGNTDLWIYRCLIPYCQQTGTEEKNYVSQTLNPTCCLNCEYIGNMSGNIWVCM